MKIADALKMSMDMGRLVGMSYLDDLTDAEMMLRPHPDCNTLNWQVGHLISSEHQMMELIAPGSMPPLADGFDTKYTKETAKSDNPEEFANKQELIEAFEAQRAASLKLLADMTDDQLAAASPEPMQNYAPTIADVFSMQGSHWLMHAGQWVIVRRNLGKPALF